MVFFENIFIRVKSRAPDAASERHALLAVQVSRDLYGSNVASAFEISKGFTKQDINGQIQNRISDDAIKAGDGLIANRKLPCTL